MSITAILVGPQSLFRQLKSGEARQLLAQRCAKVMGNEVQTPYMAQFSLPPKMGLLLAKTAEG